MLSIHLAASKQTFHLPKEWIRTNFPDSLFASAMELDPDLAELTIDQPVVTPDVMELLVKLSEGKEPTSSNSNLIQADRYLGIPSVLFYADPLYDEIPNRANVNAPENEEFLWKVIQNNRLWIYVYFIVKGYRPTYDDLTQAIRNGSNDIAKFLIERHVVDLTEKMSYVVYRAVYGDNAEIYRLLGETYPDNPILTNINSAKLVDDIILWDSPNIAAYLLGNERFDPTVTNNKLFEWATKEGHRNVITALLKRVDPRSDDYMSIAVKNGNFEIVRMLLADGRADPSKAFQVAVGTYYTDILALLLADPRIDPTANNDEAIITAAREGRGGSLHLLLLDGRANPNARDSQPLKEAREHGHGNIEWLLLADPRIQR